MPQLLMFLAILGLAFFHFSYELPRTALVGDTVIQGALNRAAVAAAQQYNPDALSVGHPMIDVTRAEITARQHVARELKLDPVSLHPLPQSPLVQPANLAVYVHNGPFPYVYSPRPGVSVRLQYPGVVLIMDATVGIAAPLKAGDTTRTISRYSSGMWMPRKKPS